MLTLYVIESCFEYYSGHLYGLEKFWAFLKYYKGHQPLDISPELTKRLSKFKTLEDFRVEAAADVSYLNHSADHYNTDYVTIGTYQFKGTIKTNNHLGTG